MYLYEKNIQKNKIFMVHFFLNSMWKQRNGSLNSKTLEQRIFGSLFKIDKSLTEELISSIKKIAHFKKEWIFFKQVFYSCRITLHMKIVSSPKHIFLFKKETLWHFHKSCNVIHTSCNSTHHLAYKFMTSFVWCSSWKFKNLTFK